MGQVVDFQKCSNALITDAPNLRLNYPKMTRWVYRKYYSKTIGLLYVIYHLYNLATMYAL